MRETTITLNYWTVPKRRRNDFAAFGSVALVARRVTMPLSILLEFANSVGSMREENLRKFLSEQTKKPKRSRLAARGKK